MFARKSTVTNDMHSVLCEKLDMAVDEACLQNINQRKACC